MRPGERAGDLRAGECVGEAITAQQKKVTRLQHGRGTVSGDEALGAKRAGEHVAGVRFRSLSGGDEAETELLVDPGVIGSEGMGRALPDEIAARVAHVRDVCHVIAQGAEDERGGDAAFAMAGAEALIMHGGIGVLYQARQEAGERGFFRRPSEAFDGNLNGARGSDFAGLKTADTISHGEEPSSRAGLLPGAGSVDTKGVFIDGAMTGRGGLSEG